MEPLYIIVGIIVVLVILFIGYTFYSGSKTTTAATPPPPAPATDFCTETGYKCLDPISCGATACPTGETCVNLSLYTPTAQCQSCATGETCADLSKYILPSQCPTSPGAGLSTLGTLYDNFVLCIEQILEMMQYMRQIIIYINNINSIIFTSSEISTFPTPIVFAYSASGFTTIPNMYTSFGSAPAITNYNSANILACTLNRPSTLTNDSNYTDYGNLVATAIYTYPPASPTLVPQITSITLDDDVIIPLSSILSL